MFAVALNPPCSNENGGSNRSGGNKIVIAVRRLRSNSSDKWIFISVIVTLDKRIVDVDQPIFTTKELFHRREFKCILILLTSLMQSN